MIERLRPVLRELRARFARWPVVTGLGLTGVGLGAVCMMALLVRGARVPPEGNLYETATFDGAVGIFFLTLAVLASGVDWTRVGRRVWVGILVPVTLYSYGIETVQAFRGLDPRFSRVAGPIDQIAGGIFFLAALVIMVCFIVVAAKYFRASATPVSVAVRYGSLAALLAFGVGIWMSVVTQGRQVPEAGNLLFLHAAGFHGLQAVPLVGLLLAWARAPEALARRRVHLAGLCWLGACTAIAWQSGSGRPVLEVAPATLAAAVLLHGWLAIAAIALRDWLQAPIPTVVSGMAAR